MTTTMGWEWDTFSWSRRGLEDDERHLRRFVRDVPLHCLVGNCRVLEWRRRSGEERQEGRDESANEHLDGSHGLVVGIEQTIFQVNTFVTDK
ncbi:hypothetical protein EJB05_40996 [Eragrostis curvula]|uniref:Uncharacterized protein n=1 Tax=Eragrostis curvula TaxID=38414 RepID=A0A5J9T8I0_9POAL|nr:hypothetical protein EJB05_40996 [Eragrostis curvula]